MPSTDTRQRINTHTQGRAKHGAIRPSHGDFFSFGRRHDETPHSARNDYGKSLEKVSASEGGVAGSKGIAAVSTYESGEAEERRPRVLTYATPPKNELGDGHSAWRKNGKNQLGNVGYFQI
jgi:hypothetical protein